MTLHPRNLWFVLCVVGTLVWVCGCGASNSYVEAYRELGEEILVLSREVNKQYEINANQEREIAELFKNQSELLKLIEAKQ